MKRIFQAICFAAALALTIPAAHGENTNTPLTFYVVSQEKIEGGKFIDTAALPKLGYVAPKPDLIIFHLKSVTTAPPGDWLNVWFLPEDAKRLQAFQSKQMLVRFGDRTLRVVNPLFPITDDLLELGFENKAELKKVEAELKKLVHDS